MVRFDYGGDQPNDEVRFLAALVTDPSIGKESLLYEKTPIKGEGGI